MTEALTPRWQEADEAVESLVAELVAAAARTADRTSDRAARSARRRPGGRTRSKRLPGTRRLIADVVRAHRLAPGVRVDRNTVAALLIGHRDLVSNPVLVVAVAQACGIITGRKLTAKKAARLRAASVRVGKLIARAAEETRRVPAQRTGTASLAEDAPVVRTAPPAGGEPPAQPVPSVAMVTPVDGATPVAVPARAAGKRTGPDPATRRQRRERRRLRQRARRARRLRRLRWLAAVALLVVVALVAAGLLVAG
ncbi:hypothetical protein Daura_27760 [Dactylosporangium aurantiacum]|uniref:Uncharacterized protein n=1 Tax=Dactylosporangium aurantiacum TaxID=35754 RepID=A0A9Q9MFG8_9ACTN|nr:hypothetical protein [Dactylosporangium aurantiacum]MDG6107028.1 hypothetical protein [Dactylosporangium aurantiacum]UWZ50621.1 hypothetical protein Daura_27760 [Dactylosporangium aurantiacum]